MFSFIVYIDFFGYLNVLLIFVLIIKDWYFIDQEYQKIYKLNLFFIL